MLRYFKRNFSLCIAALSISILNQLCMPIAALMEQQMIDLITAGDLTGFQKTLFLAGGVVFATALLYFLNALTQKKFQVRFEENLRNDLFDGVMRQSHFRFNQIDTSEQMNFIKTHASTISRNLTQPVFFLISYGVMSIAALGIMLQYSPLLTLVAIGCAVFSAIPPLFFNSKLSDQLMDKLGKDGELTFALKEALNGHETITAFSALPCMRKRFAISSHALSHADYMMQVTVSLLENVARVMQKITWFLAFLLAGGMAIAGQITIGTMMMFITLFGEFNSCVTLFAQTLPILLSTRTDIKKILAIIDEKETTFTGKKAPTFETEVEVNDLSFRYSNDVPVINHLDFTIRKNEKIALIGPSGCGKSTLIKLISGTYAGYNGTICFDGTELRELDIQKLHRLVTVIHQNTFIFNDSIRFNICLGESFPEETLQQALRISGVDRFLPTIPGGLDGVCGENGSQLSGGQKQRIALARALIRGIRVLILDDGVSAIDVETANEIEQELLENESLTLLTITHRIKDGLLKQYDRVLQMREGTLIGISVPTDENSGISNA